ncbi:MAG: hypothetical protein MUE73_06000 [Planctomycetes bacterium]|jgi:hypothetical protein|nr:hypothetical protein [Planctomycetota bacterium]
MEASLKLKSGDVTLEIEGSEEFVRRHMSTFRTLLGGTAPPVEKAVPEEAPDSLLGWYRRTVPPKLIPSMQDSVLIFAYFLNRVKRQTIFVPEDMKNGFHEVGRAVPKSLLQIMGSLKRDQNLLYSGTKRGEYCIMPQGLKYVENLLGIRKHDLEEQKAKAEAVYTAAVTPPPVEGESQAERLFARLSGDRPGSRTGGDA